MGHDKLRKFAENKTFKCLLQPSAETLLENGYFNLKDHPVKGNWSQQMFNGSNSPIVLELGCGKGEYTVALSERYPDANYIGVDIKGARLWKGAKYAESNGLGNVAFLRTRIEFITAFFAPSEVSEIWLTFSDPQFKSENSRLTSPVFLEKYRKMMTADGIVHLKTDSRFLYEYTLAVCKANGLEVIAATSDLYHNQEDAAVPSVAREVHTFYENMFLEQGYNITYLSFRIAHEGPFVAPDDFDSEYWRSVEGPRLLFGHDSAETRRQKLKL